ncbi:MAG TPA: hypothetical protein VGF94_22115 [Kofleriaceae bacterium]|jgi:hypothetical protein
MRALLLSTLLVAGCVSAQFNSTTGKSYAPLTSHAVILSADEAQQIAPQGQVIGTISAASLVRDGVWGTADNEDLAAKAAKIAAQHGGTHIVATSFDSTIATWTTPATVTRQCSHDDGDYSCEKTYTPESTGSATFPTAEFTVYRVAAAAWAALPPELRPGR